MEDQYRWIETGETVFQLEDDDSLLATLSYNEVEDLWYLQFEFGEFTDTLFLNSNDITDIKRSAIQYILDNCDFKIEDYTSIKNRL